MSRGNILFKLSVVGWIVSIIGVGYFTFILPHDIGLILSLLLMVGFLALILSSILMRWDK